MASAHDFTFTTIDNKPLDMKSLPASRCWW